MMVPMAPSKFVQVFGITLSFSSSWNINGNTDNWSVDGVGRLLRCVRRRGTRSTCYFSEAGIIRGDGKNNHNEDKDKEDNSDDENEDVDDGNDKTINHNQ